MYANYTCLWLLDCASAAVDHFLLLFSEDGTASQLQVTRTSGRLAQKRKQGPGECMVTGAVQLYRGSVSRRHVLSGWVMYPG